MAGLLGSPLFSYDRSARPSTHKFTIYPLFTTGVNKARLVKKGPSMSDNENTYTLEDLKKATQRRLAPTRLALGDDLEVELKSVFRLGKKARDKVNETLRGLDEIAKGEDEDAAVLQTIEAVGDILREITPAADQVLAAVDDPDPLVTSSLLGDILNLWLERTSAGEA